MSNKIQKGANRDKDREGVPSWGDGRSKDWGPSNQPGSATRELGIRDQGPAGEPQELTRFGPRGHSWVASSLSSISPIGTPPQATQRPGVIPGRAKGRPQGRQPKGAAVFNESLGPEARAGNVRVSRSCQPRPAERLLWGPSTPPCTILYQRLCPCPCTHIGPEAGHSFHGGQGSQGLLRPSFLPNCATASPKSWASVGFPLLSTLQASHTPSPPEPPLHSSQAKLLAPHHVQYT